MDMNANNFTAHNIRLDDGTQTLPSAGYTMDQHPVTRAVRRLLQNVFQGRLEGKSVIDVGCLEGGYATEFARWGMCSTGLEVRETNYSNCLYVRDHVNLPTLRFIHGDANDIARYGRFDVFFVNGLLYHLDRPRIFLENVARNCNKILILHTHVAFSQPTEGAQIYSLSEPSENEGLRGRWFSEHEDISREDLDRLKWTSWDNKRSFWIQKEYLLQVMRDLGFDLVLEQFDCMPNIVKEMTEGYYPKIDRVMLVGIKSSGLSARPSMPEELRSLRDEVAALRQSTSWRVTAPLRALRRLLK